MPNVFSADIDKEVLAAIQVKHKDVGQISLLTAVQSVNSVLIDTNLAYILKMSLCTLLDMTNLNTDITLLTGHDKR